MLGECSTSLSINVGITHSILTQDPSIRPFEYTVRAAARCLLFSRIAVRYGTVHMGKDHLEAGRVRLSHHGSPISYVLLMDESPFLQLMLFFTYL